MTMKSPMELAKVLSFPFLSLLFALAYFISTFSLPGIAANYPRGLIVIIVFLSLWIVISESKKTSKKRSQDESEAISLREFKRPIIGQFVLLLYIVAVPYVGFYVCSFVWMIVTSVIIDQDMRWVKLGYDIMICALFILCSYLVFKVIFFIPTPAGIWI
jgi:putative tricarboxylic transport membrane protein